MTAKQKQALLAYLGYYDGGIDGIWGPKSRQAEERFREEFGVEMTDTALKDAVVENIFPVPDVDMGTDRWEDIRYFTREEFRCKCGGRYCDGFPAEPHMVTVRFADEIRERLGKPIKVNSGLRCPRHNANTPGAAVNSNHMGGGAADLGCPSGSTPSEMYKIAEDVMGDTGGLILYSWGIHIDDRKVKYRGKGR